MTILYGILFLLVLCGLLVAFRKLIEARSFQFLGDIVHRVDVTRKMVALTFDDGPNPPFTNRILEALKEYKARATFFVLGFRLERHPSVAQQTLAEGHELGNHSFSHKYLLLRLPSTIKREIQSADELMEALCLGRPRLFRPPFGKKLFLLPYFLKKMHKTTVMCDVDSGGKEFISRNAEEICGILMSKIRPGSIIMLHDGGGDKDHIVRTVRLLLQRLTDEGYSVVTVSELLKEGSIH